MALPDSRSHLPSLSRFAAYFNHLSYPFTCRTPNSSVISDAQWWHTQLAADFCGSTLTKPPPTSRLEFWVDASLFWGIGIVFNGIWDFWRLRPGWDRDGQNIGWAEMVAIELGLMFSVHQEHSDIHFIIKSDNQGVIHAISGGKSRSPEQNLVLQRITTLLSHHKIWISSSYVPSLDNLADLPSRGLPVPGYSRASSSFTVFTTLSSTSVRFFYLYLM